MNLTYLHFRNRRRLIVVDKLILDNSNRLYAEALDLIPGAILGIRRPYNFVEGEYPIFFETAKGGKVFDVDGNYVGGYEGESEIAYSDLQSLGKLKINVFMDDNRTIVVQESLQLAEPELIG